MKKLLSMLDVRRHNIPVYQNRYYWFIAPLVVLLIALICGTVYSTEGNQYDGFANVGIDFKGGTVLTVEMKGADMIGANYEKNLEMIETIVENNGAKVSTRQTSGTNSIIVRYPNSINGQNYNDASKTEEMIAINQRISEQVTAKFKETYGSAVTVNAGAEMTNATASSELIKKAFLSVGIAMLLMMIYTAFRFDFFSGIAALANQFHDILMMLALVIIFRIQINSSLIAGLITIVGYSINNTIVIFDRIRGEVKLLKPKGSGRGWGNVRPDFQSIVNTCVSESLTRSLFTSLTTLFTITILACVGVQSLTEFALPIIFGILAGLYSAIFLGPSLWGMMQHAQVYGTKRNPKSSFKKGSTSKADQMIARKKSKKG
ncbi:MAG TPA: protein translocase subunit SecF [Candidatus Stercoripulliclostridium merdipullorum]|uniref:Protein translocase subunit SecF n=1 Tax=Candidatus Stercoripulliclostridium merdipullorum TaxID=2840952 RepID=A0A9D1NAN7_9FIRM|nr:protein translocase subunit SecF [Candidatus Stercoripulliclostridium merdipullorum]